jgi:hypothetical protein
MLLGVNQHFRRRGPETVGDFPSWQDAAESRFNQGSNRQPATILLDDQRFSSSVRSETVKPQLDVFEPRCWLANRTPVVQFIPMPANFRALARFRPIDPLNLN